MAGIEMIYPELIINTKNWQHLNHAWKSDRLPHALLFHGSQGVGKEGHALELAALLNCREVQDDGTEVHPGWRYQEAH